MRLPETRTTATKQEYISVYHSLLMAEFEKKGSDTRVLSGFMNAVVRAINGMDDSNWMPKSDLAKKAWTMVKGDGMVTIKKLRALPDGQG